MSKKRVAISIGDLNGIGLEIALLNHSEISQFCEPIYFIDGEMLRRGAELLNLDIPNKFETVENIGKAFQIEPSKISKKSGLYSYNSFIKAVDFVKGKRADAIVTLPISKEAWHLADMKFSGHTDALRKIFDRDAIMLMGTPEMYVALFTEHIPLRKVADEVQHEKLHIFLKNLLVAKPDLERVGVLGLNPHSGDGGVLGNEERIIENVVRDLNREIGREIFSEPLVPDIAFTPHMRAKYKFYVAIYHDQGLIPLKTLYFHESINISLNLPIVRTSVGHGTAFDIAYKKDRVLDGRSYINAIKEAIL